MFVTITDLFPLIDNNHIEIFKNNFNNNFLPYRKKIIKQKCKLLHNYNEDNKLDDKIIILIYSMFKGKIIISDYILRSFIEDKDLIHDLLTFIHIHRITQINNRYYKDIENMLNYLYNNEQYNDLRLKYDINYFEKFNFEPMYSHLSRTWRVGMEITDYTFEKTLHSCAILFPSLDFSNKFIKYVNSINIYNKRFLDKYNKKYFDFIFKGMFITATQLFNLLLSYEDFVEYIEKDGYDINEKFVCDKIENYTVLLYHMINSYNKCSEKKFIYLVENNAILPAEKINFPCICFSFETLL